MKETKHTQRAFILGHLLEGKAITPLEALKMCGSFRLGAHIFDLRQQGYPIETEYVKHKKSMFAKYYIKPELLAHAKSQKEVSA